MYCVASWWCCIQPQNCWWFSKSTMYLLCRLFYFYLKSFFSRYISFISRVWYPLFQGWIVLRSIVMVLYSAPELLMIQRANFAKSQISSLQLRKIWHLSLPTGSISNWKFYEQNQLLFLPEFQSKNLRNSNAFLTTIPTRKSESDRSRCHWKSSKMYIFKSACKSSCLCLSIKWFIQALLSRFQFLYFFISFSLEQNIFFAFWIVNVLI